MENFLGYHLVRVIATVVVLLLFPTVRYLLNKLIGSYSGFTSMSKTRTAFMKKATNFLLVITLIILLITIWGVRPQNIFLAVSSIFAIIGVAFFAQWSVLSNVTTGFVLFFTQQLKIGTKIEILDKDFPTIAEVEDIKSFYVYLRGEDGQRYIYPNNLFLQKGFSIVEKKKKPKTDQQQDLPTF